MNDLTRSRWKPFTAGFILGAICSLVTAIGLFSALVWMAVPASGKDPAELLRMIEAAAPDAPAITHMDFIIHAGMPRIDIVHTEGERTLYIAMYRADAHYFEVVTDSEEQIVFIHYFTGEARLSRERIFVYDREQYEWLLLHSSLVTFSSSD